QWIDAFNRWDSALDLLASTAKRICARSSDAAELPALAGPDAEKPRVIGREPLRGTLEIPGAELEEARNVLAYFVGPIAHLLVKRAARVAASLSDFRERLASE